MTPPHIFKIEEILYNNNTYYKTYKKAKLYFHLEMMSKNKFVNISRSTCYCILQLPSQLVSCNQDVVFISSYSLSHNYCEHHFFMIFQISFHVRSFLFQRELPMPNSVTSAKITLICSLFSQILMFEDFFQVTR